MIAQLPNLDTILKRHEIHPKFWPEMHLLVEEGQRPCRALVTRLNHVANYKAAFDEIAAELSKGLEHKFPPADYEVPDGYFDAPARHKSLAPKTSPRRPSGSTRVCRQSP
jgi:hypothetical protein